MRKWSSLSPTPFIQYIRGGVWIVFVLGSYPIVSMILSQIVCCSSAEAYHRLYQILVTFSGMFKWFLSCLFHRPNLDESVKAVNPISHFIDKSPVLKLERNSILGRIIRFTFHLHTRRISLSYSQICRHVMLVVRKLINFDTRFFQTNYDSLCCESKIVTLAHKNRLPLKLSSPILFIYIFMYLRSPILGRVTTTALGAKYCWPVTVLPLPPPPPWERPPHRGLRSRLFTNNALVL